MCALRYFVHTARIVPCGAKNGEEKSVFRRLMGTFPTRKKPFAATNVVSGARPVPVIAAWLIEGPSELVFCPFLPSGS